MAYFSDNQILNSFYIDRLTKKRNSVAMTVKTLHMYYYYETNLHCYLPTVNF